MNDDPSDRGDYGLNESLGRALRNGEHGLSTVPELLKRVLREQTWREFVTRRGDHVTHERFTDFVTTPPLKGIGGTVDMLRNICRDDPEALDLLDQALQRPVGNPTFGITNSDNSTNSVIPRDPNTRGTSRDYSLRKLRKDAPALHGEVLAGKLSAHAAMVQAGFRPKTFTVRPDRPSSVAQSLRNHMTDEQWQQFKEAVDET